MDEFPVYVKEGAIIPMNIERDYTNIGDENSSGFTTILIYPEGENGFTYYHTDTKGETEIYYDFNDNQSLKVNLKGTQIRHILTIQSKKPPNKVNLDGSQLIEEENWKFDSAKQKLIIKTQNYTKGNYEITY